jgi:single-strand DNA-binding protein
MQGTPITIVGNVMDDVVLKITRTGVPRLSFRVINSVRYLDQDSEKWVDGKSFAVRVTAWRDLAENVADSIRKGDPVIIRGRISSSHYIKDESSRISYEVEPDSIGHDLSRGVSVFTKRKRSQFASVEADADGLPSLADVEDYEVVGDGEIDSGFAERLLSRPMAEAG